QTAARVTAVTSVRRAKRENEQNPERTRKKKAYLAVVISSLNQAPINVDRIRIIAETIGPTKKVWRSSENTVSLIFEEHESAKKFMFHYHKFVHFYYHILYLLLSDMLWYVSLAFLPDQTVIGNLRIHCRTAYYYCKGIYYLNLLKTSGEKICVSVYCFIYITFSRVIHGVQLAVTLQKLFANLTELP
ncbi:unnamed protein product, partial [Brugia timori]|uniref:RB_B domain-containing protein n=1 Tax=Brugia timori TaxID=42155 RepID=A0A0R3R2B0_9BILA